jgi:chromosome segregation ATPase
VSTDEQDDVYSSRRSPRDRSLVESETSDLALSRLRAILDVRTLDLHNQVGANQTLGQRLTDQEQKIRSLQEDLEDRDDDIRELQAELYRDAERLSQKTARVTELQQRSESLSAEVRATRSTLEKQAQVAAQNRSLEQDNRALTARLHAVQTRQAKDDDVARRVDGRLADAEVEIAQLRAKNAELRVQLDAVALDGEKDELLRTAASAEAENAQLRRVKNEQNTACEARLAVQAEVVRALAVDLESCTRENGALKKYVRDLQAQLNSAHMAAAEFLKERAGRSAREEAPAPQGSTGDGGRDGEDGNRDRMKIARPAKGGKRSALLENQDGNA